MLVNHGEAGEAPHGAARWLVQQSRFTVFHPGGDVAADLQDWWQDAFGAVPDIVESRPGENTVRVRGDSEIGHWTAAAAPGRTDFVLEPDLGDSAAVGDVWPLPDGATYRETASEMANLVEGWLVNERPVYRLAVGARLLAPGPDLSFVYSALGVFLPGLNLEGLRSPDFVLRVNRERCLTVGFSFAVNRLAAWAVAQGQSVSVSPAAGGVDVAPVRYAAHLDLDINTRTDESCSFSGASTGEVFQALREMSVEIAEKGDVP